MWKSGNATIFKCNKTSKKKYFDLLTMFEPCELKERTLCLFWVKLLRQLSIWRSVYLSLCVHIETYEFRPSLTNVNTCIFIIYLYRVSATLWKTSQKDFGQNNCTFSTKRDKLKESVEMSERSRFGLHMGNTTITLSTLKVSSINSVHSK